LWSELSVLEGQNEDLVESIDRGIWDAIVNDPFIPKFEKK